MIAPPSRHCLDCPGFVTGTMTAWMPADALFELADAAICTDSLVTSLAQLSLAPVFRRGHGALYDA
jgi:hypothetical protein